MFTKAIVENTDSINIKVGVFFDGTGCNAKNLISSGVSDEKMFSNIYRMYNYYDVNNNDVMKLYIEGVGTIDGKDDSTIVKGTGRDVPWHKSGVFSKYENSVNSLAQEMLKNIELKKIRLNGCKYINIEFDLFGFSRGAAIARHFANKISLKDKELFSVLNTKLSEHNVAIGSMTTNYLGLYDTVATVWGYVNAFFCDPHDTGNTNGLLVNLPKKIANHVFQITAQHECRYNFPLSDLKSIYPQLELIGSHSDIGGSYPSNSGEFLNLTGWCWTEKGCREEMITISERELWKKIINKDNFNIYPATAHLGYNGKVTRTVKGDLAYVALLIMSKAATTEGKCCFGNLISDYENKLPNDLYDYYNKATFAYSELMAGHPAVIDKKVIEAVACDYVHISSYYSGSTEATSHQSSGDETIFINLTLLTQDEFDKLSNDEKEAMQQRFDSIFGNTSPQRPDAEWCRKTWPNNQQQNT